VKYVDSRLGGGEYLMGKHFTVADGYLFTMLSWADRMKFDLSGLPNLLAYKARVGARPMAQEALPEEGVMKAAGVVAASDKQRGRIDDPAPFSCRHCEPTGRANARPMTGS